MKHKQLVLPIGIIVIISVITLISCKKINESTELGGDLIPVVDNIHTFDTTLEVEAFNDSFTLATDSTYYFPTYEHFVGQINNDPIFGKTDAKLSLQVKPGFFPFTFLNKPDSLFIDSVVLVLDYVETYGDTTLPQTVNVYEIAQATDFRADTGYKVRQNNIIKAGLLGTRTYTPRDLNDSVKAFNDTTINQLRIRLDNSFGQRLLSYDSAAAYGSDSLFNTKLKGLTLEATGGNALIGVNLSTITRLAIYYRYNNKSPTDLDTTVAYFPFNSVTSASANYITRDYSGSEFAGSVGGTTPDNMVYIQNTPGTFARIKIPGLRGLSNRIVHRAELIMEQIHDQSDTLFLPPSALFLDAYDSSISDYRNVPYDFFFDGSGNPSYNTFGDLPFRAADGAGNPINTWHFNLSRYVQNIVNGKEKVYDLRLFAPLETFIQYRFNTQAETTKSLLTITGVGGKGRVRLGGGNHPTQKMRLRIVYSKI